MWRLLKRTAKNSGFRLKWTFMLLDNLSLFVNLWLQHGKFCTRKLRPFREFPVFNLHLPIWITFKLKVSCRVELLCQCQYAGAAVTETNWLNLCYANGSHETGPISTLCGVIALSRKSLLQFGWVASRILLVCYLALIGRYLSAHCTHTVVWIYEHSLQAKLPGWS